VTIRYINTDLDLTSPEDLTALAATFRAQGVPPLYVTAGDNGLWYATFETNDDYDEPEPNIAAMLAVIESLKESVRGMWWACTRREFNIGYDCGSKPWAFNNGLSRETLRRMADVGTSLHITLYPRRRAKTSRAAASDQ
jgi:hypothetical protein